MKCFVGVDVSKSTLDVSVLTPESRSREFTAPNTEAGISRLMKRVQEIASGVPIHWCLETTGAYHWEFALALSESGQLVSVENPRRVKHYGVAIGAVQKTDRADARVIAKYAKAFEPAPWSLRPEHLRELVFLDRRITELDCLITQERNRLEMKRLPELVKQGVEESTALFRQQRKGLEKRIREILKQDEDLGKAVELLSSIPGISERSSVGLIAEAGDIKRFSCAEDYAAYFGLNPRIRRSGSSINGRTRISKAGNAHGRRRLYMPALVAIRVNPHIKEFYERLLAAHKPKKCALIACERKLVMLCYGVLRSQKPYDPMHGRLTT